MNIIIVCTINDHSTSVYGYRHSPFSKPILFTLRYYTTTVDTYSDLRFVDALTRHGFLFFFFRTGAFAFDCLQRHKLKKCEKKLTRKSFTWTQNRNRWRCWCYWDSAIPIDAKNRCVHAHIFVFFRFSYRSYICLIELIEVCLITSLANDTINPIEPILFCISAWMNHGGEAWCDEEQVVIDYV